MIVCEGYMDVIAMHQAGFSNAVASLGTAFTGLQANLLKRYADEILLLYDSDGAGVKAALRAIPILKEAGLIAKVVQLTPYKDPDEFIKALGREEFQKRLNSAENRFYNEMAKKLLVFTEELERNNYIEAMANRYRIPFEDLRNLVNKYGAQQIVAPQKVVRTQSDKAIKKEEGIAEAQKILLTWLIEDLSLFEKVKEILSVEDFREEPYHTVSRLLFQQYKETGQVNPAQIINQFQSKEEQNVAASLFSRSLREELTAQEKERAFNETIIRIKKETLDYKNKHATDIAELQQIIKEQAELQKLHISL